MFDDLCHGGVGKYAFPVMMMGSLALHVWDVASDILVAILLYHEDVFFFIIGSDYGVGEFVQYENKYEGGKIWCGMERL